MCVYLFIYVAPCPKACKAETPQRHPQRHPYLRCPTSKQSFICEMSLERGIWLTCKLSIMTQVDGGGVGLTLVCDSGRAQGR